MGIIGHEPLLDRMQRLKDELSGCLIVSKLSNGNYEVFDLRGPMAHAMLEGLRLAEKRQRPTEGGDRG